MTASDNGAGAFTGRKGDLLRLRWLSEDIASWRLAWDDGLGRHAAGNVGWREDGQIGIAPVESIKADLAIPYGCKLTSQDTRRRTVLGRWRECVDGAV
jgi:hypothetical protein